MRDTGHASFGLDPPFPDAMASGCLGKASMEKNLLASSRAIGAQKTGSLHTPLRRSTVSNARRAIPQYMLPICGNKTKIITSSKATSLTQGSRT